MFYTVEKSPSSSFLRPGADEEFMGSFGLQRSSSYPYVSLSNLLAFANYTFLPPLWWFHPDTNGRLLTAILDLDEEAIGKSLLWVTMWKLILVPKGILRFLLLLLLGKKKKKKKGGVGGWTQPNNRKKIKQKNKEGFLQKKLQSLPASENCRLVKLFYQPKPYLTLSSLPCSINNMTRG